MHCVLRGVLRKARDVCRRATALGTVGALFALPDSDAERALPELFREFVRRSLDQKVHRVLSPTV